MLLSRSLTVGVLGLAVLAGACDRQSSENKQPGATPQAAASAAKEGGTLDRSKKGEAIPDITVIDPDGKQLKLASLTGKPLLINLWATWCAPCIAELPTLNSIANRADQNVQVVTVSQDMGDPAKVQSFLDQKGFAQLPAWIDTKGDLPIHYGAQTLPATVYYDAAGKEVWRYFGGMDWAGADAAKLLAEAQAQ